MNRKTVLITGGAGFIGSHIIDELADDYLIVVIDNNIKPNLSYKNPKAKYYSSDILAENLTILFEKYKFDIVIHLAAQVSVSVSLKFPDKDAETNIIGTVKLLNLCKQYGVKKIIAASSAAIYGNPQYLPIDEKHPCNPISPYGLSKLTMEKYIMQSGLDYIIFRFANVYGERQNSEGEAGVVAIFNNAIKNNKNLYINGDGEQTRDFIYVKDIAKIISLALVKNIKNEIVNVSTKQPYSINELAKTMLKLSTSKSKIFHNKIRNGDIKHSILDNNYLLNLLNGFTYTQLEDGLKCLIKETEISYD